MDNELPDPPISMIIYNKIKSKIRPNYSSKYILAESILSGLFVSGLNIFVGLSIYLIIPIFLSFLIIPSFLIYNTDSDKRDNPLYLLNVSNAKLGLIVSLSIITLIPLLFYESGISTTSMLIATTQIGYILSFVTRTDIYRSERSFYTNTESNVNELWDKASISMERATNNIKNNNLREGYFWIKQSEKLYEEISEEEKRPMLKEAASLLVSTCIFYSASIHTYGNRALKYEKTARSLYQESQGIINYRLCDSCKKVRKKSDTKRINNYNIICSACVYESQNTKSEFTDDNINKNEKEKKYKSGQITKSKFDDLSVQEAINTLDLNKPISNIDEIHKAFRKKVKNAHPDTGGSENEFKKVKKSREILIDKYK